MSELLTVAQVASVLKCSEDTVVRRFEKYRGVIDLGTPETRGRRRYRVLRIPVSIVEKYLVEKSGAPVKIELPEKAERHRKSQNWQSHATMNLAKAGKQNECTDRKVFRQIADRARLLAAKVPEQYWPEIEWIDDDEE